MPHVEEGIRQDFLCGIAASCLIDSESSRAEPSGVSHVKDGFTSKLINSLDSEVFPKNRAYELQIRQHHMSTIEALKQEKWKIA